MNEFWALLLLSPLAENPANNEAKDKEHHQTWKESRKVLERSQAHVVATLLSVACLTPARAY